MNETTGQCETPMRDHVARFWSLLASGKVRICVDADFHEGSGSFFSSSMFSDNVAKALIEDRASTDKVREVEAEVTRLKDLCTTISDAVVVDDSYGVPGSSFSTCLVCQRGGVPGPWKHDEHCPVAKAEEVAAQSYKENSEIYDDLLKAEAALAEARKVIERQTEVLNTPHLEDFITAAAAEARHQRYRWGDEQDATKTAWDWFWTLGYLGGKAAHSALAGDWDKAKHHTITAAALLANWHRHIIAAERHPEQSK